MSLSKPEKVRDGAAGAARTAASSNGGIPERVLIERRDFLRLSASAQKEIMDVVRRRRAEPARTARRKPSRAWVVPFDLGTDLANRLLHGLAENHRRRLALFARGDGRVGMKELLAVTGDKDIRVLSYFQGALNRKLRRIVGDEEKKLFLIGWDYDSTKWDADHTKIVDGVCYVTDKTAAALRTCMT